MTENENAEFIKRMAENTTKLLNDHWGDIMDYRNGAEDVKVSFVHALKYEGQNRRTQTTISFAKRMKDSIESSFDTDQMSLSLEGPAKRKRGRPRKVTPETTIVS